MSEQQAPIRFERVRSFGRIFGETRKFIRENFTVFFKTILFLVGPVALLTCTLNMFFQVNLLTPGDVPEFNRIGSYLALSTIYTQVRWGINGLITAIVVSHFVKVYREKGQGKFTVNDVTKSIFRDFFGNVLAFIVMFFSVALISTVLGYVIYGLAEVSIGAAILMIFAGWLAYILVRFPFWYFVFSVFFARTAEKNNVNVFSAMGTAGKVFSGNWWSTWVVFFCMWLVLYIIGTAISMPAQIIAAIAQLSTFSVNENSANMKLLQTVLLSLGEFAKTIVNSVMCVTVALHFFGLKEKIDGEGTKKIVEMIGSKQEDESVE
ncbi:MAG TPA: hypothetical protein VFJ43_08345, partial [Bacteroidia bacterium]|nr:hypothetical protein [Bacteroidia bacterium]